MTSTQKAVRRWVLTGCVTAITVTGSLYGATLKEDLTVYKEKQRLLQATPEERIAQLEVARAEMVTKKTEMELKIKRHREKIKAKEQAQIESSK